MVFIPVPGTELLNTWNLLNDDSDPGVFRYVNEAAFPKLLGNLSMGPSYPQNQPDGKNLETFHPNPLTTEEERRATEYWVQ